MATSQDAAAPPPPATNEANKLSSLFQKKKKGGAKTLNATAIAKAQATSQKKAPAAAPASAPKAATPAVEKSKSPTLGAATPTKTVTKTLKDLTLGEQEDTEEKREFQWAKKPKKYRADGKEAVARTWEEQQARNRVARRIDLQSERAFPTLGAESNPVPTSGMHVPQQRSLETKNVWATLGQDDDDE